MGLRAVAVLATAALTFALAAPATADTPPAQAQRRLRVATYNLYLGANLVPLFSAPPEQVVETAATAWAHVQATDFRIRAEAIADLIAEEHPHLVALQEVALWQTAPTSNPLALTTQYDFLQILLDELAQRGAPYTAAAVNPHFTGMLPVSATTLVRFTERNAIIARADLEPESFVVTNPVERTFVARVPLSIGGQPIAITRGFATVDVQFRGKWIRFATAHLEAFSDVVRKLQAHELVDALAPSPYDVVLAGDLNSLRDFVGDSWQILTAAGYTDVWNETMPGAPGYTASFGDDLVGPPSELDHTVDYIMRSTVGTIDGIDGDGEILGEEVDDQTSTGGWPSDHAGVAGTVQIVKN
jgi:endonuclease/exonuclease/phosphatase family metal-dependent hydrolase